MVWIKKNLPNFPQPLGSTRCCIYNIGELFMTLRPSVTMVLLLPIYGAKFLSTCGTEIHWWEGGEAHKLVITGTVNMQPCHQASAREAKVKSGFKLKPLSRLNNYYPSDHWKRPHSFHIELLPSSQLPTTAGWTAAFVKDWGFFSEDCRSPMKCSNLTQCRNSNPLPSDHKDCAFAKCDRLPIFLFGNVGRGIFFL